LLPAVLSGFDWAAPAFWELAAVLTLVGSEVPVLVSALVAVGPVGDVCAGEGAGASFVCSGGLPAFLCNTKLDFPNATSIGSGFSAASFNGAPCARPSAEAAGTAGTAALGAAAGWWG